MKKILTFLLSVIVAFSCLLSCNNKIGGGNNLEGNADIPEGVVISSNGKEVYMGTKEGKERLKISYTLSGYGSTWIQVLAAKFVEKYPEYWLFLDGDSGLTTSMPTKLETGLNVSDIYMALNSPWSTYASYGWVEEISDVYDTVLEGETESIYQKMNPLWQEYCTSEYLGVEGKYAFPWTQSISGIAYNATMFEKYGWEVPETMEELIVLCEQILSETNGEIAPFVYPGVVGGYYGYLVSQWWIQSSGLDGIREFYRFEDVSVFDYKKQPRKGLYEALKAFDSVFGNANTKYSLRGSMSKNHTEAQLAFLRGEAAMIPNASWFECEMQEDIPENLVVKLMAAPYIETAQKDGNGEFKKVSYGCHPDYMIIAKGAPNVEGAKKFLVFTSGEDMLKLFTKYTGTLRPLDYDYMSLYESSSPFVQSCMDIYNNSDWFMESSPSKMYKSGLVDMYLTQIPYPALVYGVNNGGTTVDAFMKAEYLTAIEEWDERLSRM